MNGYKFEDIEKLFAEKVANYLTQGYIFRNPRSMGDEIIKVDLKKDGADTYIRIMLLHGYERELDSITDPSEFYHLDTISLIVGKYDKSRHFEPFNKDVSVVESVTFYTHKFNFSDNAGYFTTDKDVAIGWSKMSHARHRASHIREKEWDKSSRDARIAVLPFVKRQQGCKTKKESDIVSITKVPKEDRDVYTRFRLASVLTIPMHYRIYMKNGKVIRLGYKEIVKAI